MTRIALITGGARGIGYGIARSLAAEGWALALSGTRPAADVAPALEALRTDGADLLYCQSDVADRAARAALLDAVRTRYGQLHVLVNNAGVAPTVRADLLEASEESYERVLRINLQGPYFLTQAVARWLIEQKRADTAFSGGIVNISSVSASVVSTNRGEYCISKAGVSMATQLWAARLAEFDLPVYEVRPGIVRSDMTAGVAARYDRLIADGLIPQARWGLPEDVGRAVAALVRGDLAYSTGQIINVDGGLSLRRL